MNYNPGIEVGTKTSKFMDISQIPKINMEMKYGCTEVWVYFI